jgi:hypothetical protein
MDETASTQLSNPFCLSPLPQNGPQSRFQQGDRVQFESYSTGKVLGHLIRDVNSQPVIVLIVLLDPEYRFNRWMPVERWIETDKIRRLPSDCH